LQSSKYFLLQEKGGAGSTRRTYATDILTGTSELRKFRNMPLWLADIGNMKLAKFQDLVAVISNIGVFRNVAP
jgi:hypothetical protein